MAKRTRINAYAPSKFDHGEPLSRFSTLPLAIFATCILAFAMTVWHPPVHAFHIALPQYGTQTLNPAKPFPKDAQRQQLTVSPTNEILWEGEAISMGELVRNLQGIQHSGLDAKHFCLGELSQHRDFQAALSANLEPRLNTSGTYRLALMTPADSPYEPKPPAPPVPDRPDNLGCFQGEQ